VNQRYVIATSTKVPLAGVDVSKIDDKFFAREKKTGKKVNFLVVLLRLGFVTLCRRCSHI
jgi:hypothetical protein